MSHHAAKSGVSLAEYGLILACVACLCIAALQSLGSQISGNLNFISREISKISGTLGATSSPPGLPSSPGGSSSPPSPPANPPNLDVGINGTGMSPYPNEGIAGSVAGVGDKSPVAATNRPPNRPKP